MAAQKDSTLAPCTRSAGSTRICSAGLTSSRTSAGTDASSRIALARFFAENFAVQAPALERIVVEGAPGVIGADPVLS